MEEGGRKGTLTESPCHRSPSRNKAEALAAWSKEAPLHGKLTYIGPQEKPTRSVIFHVGASVPEGLFQPFQSPGVSYLNDTAVEPASFSITLLEEQARILAALAGSGLDQNSPNTAEMPL